MVQKVYTQMISNLHSLLSGKWYIDPSFISGFMPMLNTILTGGKIEMAKQPEPFKAFGHGVSSNNYSNNSKADEKYVMVYPIKSAIYKYNQECGPRGTKHHQKVLQEYLNDPLCAGVVLDIDSGGGQVAGTPEFYDFLKSASKPVHTYTDGMLCSAAYYIASATNSITANPRADAIGSIGTMVSFVDLTGYYEKQGAKVITEYATKSTGKNKAFRDLLAGNPETYILNELDPITDTFINDVKATRSTITDTVFDGSTYNAEDALQMGLIDQVGQITYVIQSIFNADKKPNNNSKSNMKMSNHTKVMAVLGLATLAITDDKGSFFNEEQLQSMEDALTANENTVATLTTNLQTANDAKATAETNLQTATQTHQSNLDTVAAALGLEAGATVDAITQRIAALKPSHTDPTGTEKPEGEGKKGFDPNAAHNQYAKQYLNK